MTPEIENLPENTRTCALCGGPSDKVNASLRDGELYAFYGICYQCVDEPSFDARIEAAYELAFGEVTIQ